MSCILCFNFAVDDSFLSIHDYSEVSMATALELIQKHFSAFSEKILSDDIERESNSSVCKNCWSNLEAFDEFHTLVASNYNVELKDHKALIQYDPNISADLIVYEEQEIEEKEDILENELIKIEALNESEDFEETEWTEESKEHENVPVNPLPPKKRRVPSIQQPRAQRITGLDTADDQRIRETAEMYCEICSEPLDSLRDAKSHYKLSHGVRGYISCCERRFNQRCRLVEHVNTHFNFNYICSICAKTFDSKSYLTKHLATHDDVKLFECAHCPKVFSRKFQVRNHLLSVHIFDNIEPTLECPMESCDKKFVSQARLKHHIDYTHSTTHQEICEVCTKVFKTKNAIDEHMKTHARRVEDRIRCEICGHYLADLKSYNRHVKNHSTEQLDNTCNYCGKKSPNLNALKKHIRYVHEMTKTFQCRFCEKSFKRPRNLIDHEAAMHTLQDLYACTFCSKTFRNQSNMLAHRKKQHPDQYQKPKYMRDSFEEITVKLT